MTATITKTKTAEQAGTYIPTSEDARKATAQVTIIGYHRNRTEIRSRLLLSGSGVRLIRRSGSTAQYLVTDEALTEIRRRFDVVTDF